MSLLEKFKKYLQDQTTPASKATIKNYLADVGQFIKWCEDKFGYFSPKDINYVTISTYKKIKNDSGISLSSIDRHISSLRKFHTFLSISSHDIESNPFVDPISNFNNIVPTDKWSIKKFKDYLYACNSSPLTIKNYIADVRQFTNWIESHMAKNGQGIWTENLLEKIDNSLLQKYKDNLINSNISALSINRKLSSNRKYTGWAQDKGLMHFQSEIINIKKPTSQYSIPKNNNDLSSNVNMIKTNNSLYSNNDNRLKIKYSILPPIRLLQKIWNGILWILDEIFTGHIIDIIENIDYLLWKSNGKRIFVNTKKISKNIINNISSNKKLTIANISKYDYSHHEISTTSVPLHFKILHHLRNTRPNWYHKYHSYSISHYLHFAILVIVMSALGFGFYQKFIQETGTKSIALAGPISPNRVLSFQGRLTDSNDIPITSQKKLRFSIYSNETSTAAAAIEPFLWQELRIATPDADGIFSVLLGSNPTGGPTGLCGDFPATTPCGIKQSIFGDHDLLWLGVSVENDSELTPRQQIATVAFATNSELLQGLPPTIDTAWISNNTNTNAILALNSSGTLSIGGASGSKTTFQANGKYTLTGRVLSINTTAGTDTNIEITPDGIGKIDVQKPLQNSTSSNNILSSIGSVEIDDTFSVLATSSGIPAATINQNGSGDIFTASSSGNTKFTITNSGNVGIGSVTPGYKLDVTGDINVSGGFKVNGVSFTGSSQWTTNLDNSIYFNTGNVGIGTTAPIGLLHVSGSVGGNSIGIINNEGSVGDIFTASSSGNTKFTITNFGNVGIGSITPNAKLQIVGSNTSNSIFAANIGGSTGTGLIVTNSGNVGIGSVTPGYKLDVTGDINVSGGFKVNGSSFGNQWITSVNTISNSNSGNVGIGSITPNAKLQIFGDDALNTSFAANIGGNNALETGLVVTNLNNVGIGTTVPFFKLDIDGDIGPSSDNAYNIGSSSLRWGTIYANSVNIPASNGSFGPWVINGNLLSTTNPSFDLLIGGSASNSASFQIFAGTDIGINARAGDASTSGSLVFNGAASPTIDILNNQRLDFQTSSGGDTGLTARLSILGNGNVGIGTTAPGGSLSVVSGNISGTTADSAMSISANSLSTGTGFYSASSSLTSGKLVDLQISGTLAEANQTGLNILTTGTNTSNAITTYGSKISNTHTNSTSGTNIALYLNASGATTANYGLIVDSGSVGIGTTAPLAKLGVVGIDSLNTSFAANIGGSTGTGLIVTNSGNVGIGTTVPLATLDVRGNLGTAPVASFSGQTSFATMVVGNDGFGDIFTASKSGLTKFTILNSGNAQFSGDALPDVSSTRNLGSLSKYWQSIYVSNIFQPSGNGVFGPWVINGNLLSTTNPSFDLLIGGSASNSASFQIFAGTDIGINARAGDASTSGSLVFNGAASPTIDILNNQRLDFQTSSGGDTGLTARLSILGNGNVGIGTTAPGGSLSVVSGNISGTTADSAMSISANSLSTGTGFYSASSSLTSGKLVDLQISGTLAEANQTGLNILTTGTNTSNAITTYGSKISNTHTNSTSGTNIALYLNASGATTANYGLIVDSGSVGIGTTAPLATLDVRGNLGTAPVASFSGQTSFATMVVGNDGFGDIFTASKSGLTKFTILNSGNAQFSGDALPDVSSTRNLGSSNKYWQSIYVNNIFQPIQNGTSGFWTLTDSAIYPTVPIGQNNLLDLAVGSTNGTASAKFQIFGSSVGDIRAGDASTSASLVFNGAASPTIDILNNQRLDFQTSSGGDTGLTARLSILGNGNIGIGTTAPGVGKLQLANGNIIVDSNYGIDTATTGTLNVGNTNATTINLGTSATARTIAIGNVTGATALNFNAGTGGTTYTTTNGVFNLNTGTGSINLGTDAAAKTIAIGNVTGATALNFNAGTGGTTYTTTNGVFNLNTGTGSINLGTDAAAKTIAIGNVTGATALNFNAGTGGTTYTTTNGVFNLNTGTGSINLGTDATAKTIAIGNVTGATALNFNAGTGGTTYTTTNGVFNLNTGTGSINLGTDATAKTIAIGNVTGATALNFNAGTGGTTYTTTNGVFNLNTGTGSINLGTDATAKTIAIGNVTGATALNFNAGTGDMILTSTDDIRLNSSKMANSGVNEVFAIKSTIDNLLTDELFQVGDSLMDMLTVMGDGSVGIGTTAPLATLDVRGNLGTAPVASFSGQTSFATMVVGNDGFGDIFTASKSGLTKFTILNSGNAQFSGDALPDVSSTRNLGSSNKYWQSIYVNNIFQPIQNGTSGFWTLTDSAMYPIVPIGQNNLLDLAVGSTNGTASAKFQIFGSSVGDIRAGDASTSASLVFNGAASPTIDILNNQRLDFQTSSGGDTGLTARLSILGNGNIGIGTTAPLAKLGVVGIDSLNTSFAANIGGSTGTGLIVTNSGNVGIGTTAPGALLDLGNAGTKLGVIRLAGNTSGNVTIQPASAAGSWTLTLPTTQGTNTYLLSTNGSGATTWTDPGTLAVKWNSIYNPNGNQSITMNANTTTWNWATATTGDQLAAAADALTTGTLFNLSSTSTNGDTSKILKISRSGVNGTSSRTNYGLHSSITNSGTTSTNIAGYFSATNGTNNYAGIFENGNVGIGTTEPSFILDIKTGSSIHLSTTLGQSVTSGPALIAHNDAAVALVPLEFRASSYYFHSGNVGIGTTGPDTPLQVSASAPAQGILSHLTNSSGTGGAYEQFTQAGVVDWAIGAKGNNTNFVINTGKNVLSAGIDLVTITTAGNVGIGTTSPTQLLHISANSANDNGGHIKYENTNSSTGPATNAQLIGMSKYGTLQNMVWENYGARVGMRSVTNSGAGDVYFTSGNDGVFMVGKMDGSVGIGTTAPLAKLGVVGIDSLNTSFAANIGGSTGTGLIVTNSGNVGIGTTAPLATLDVRGNLGTAPVASFSGQTSFATMVVGNDGFGDIFTASKSGLTKFTILNSGNAQFSGDALPDVSSTRNLGSLSKYWNNIYVNNIFQPVGNGTSGFWTLTDSVMYPTQYSLDLAVGSTNGTASAKFQIFGSSVGDIRAGDASTSASLVFNGAASPTIDILNNQRLDFQTSSGGDTGLTARLSILGNGNVGIGTTAPLAKLGVVGIDSLNTSFAANIGGSTGTGLIVTNSGNVGIGTTAPLATLDVRGNLGTAPVASFSGQTSFATMVVGNDGFGDIFTASKSGLTKFTILNSGNAQFSGDALPDVSSTRNLGSLSKYWNNIYVNNIFQPVGNGTSGFWTLTDSVMYPTQYSLDLAVGSTNGTASAKFQIFGSSVGDIRAGDASTSASLVFNGAASPTIDILNNQRLDFQTSSGGDTGLTARLSILGNGNVGIGTTAPLATLDVRGNLGTAPVASFSGQTSFATMVVGNDGFGDIFTASKSGLTKFTILNSGNVGIGTTVASRTLSINGETEANAFYDISNNSYFLDPAAVGTSLIIAGSASFNGDLTLGGGTGKLDVGTVDPPYTINGEKYATFIPAMTGIKEETTGKARTSEYVSGLGYKYTIDFTKVEKGSDLWLFSKATDMGKNIGKIIPLMSATDNTKIWYNIDESNYSLTLYSAKPTTIAYRLTAPRFDADIIDITKSSSPGFILNDGKELHAMTKSGNFTDEELLNINNLQIIKYESRYDLRTKSGEIIHEVASYSEIVVANLRAGLINAREIIAKSITTGQLTVSEEIISPIAEIDRIHTNLISPLSSDNIVVDGKLVIANKENMSDNEIILEVQGNASISGVLRAGKIIADEIIGLDAKIATLAGKNITNITNIYSNASTSATIDSQNDSSSGDNIAKINTEDLLIDVPIFSGLQNINPSILANDIVTDFIDTASLSGQLAKITNFQSMFGRFDQIMVTGPASFNDISIVGQLSIGGNMIFADNSLNVLGADLELQSLKQGGISIAGKMIYIDANGNINSKGNATFAKEVNIGGTLSTNTISPNKDSDLVINLPEISKTNQDFSKKGSNFIVNNASQSAVFALDQEGNMQASGSADFKNILANALKIVRNVQADTSFTETVATSSAGTATIITGETERTIITPYSTKDALIYLTSASDMDGLSPYVARQTIADESLGIKASFTIQISQRLNKDVKINWIIIN